MSGSNLDAGSTDTVGSGSGEGSVEGEGEGASSAEGSGEGVGCAEGAAAVEVVGAGAAGEGDGCAEGAAEGVCVAGGVFSAAGAPQAAQTSSRVMLSMAQINLFMRTAPFREFLFYSIRNLLHLQAAGKQELRYQTVSEFLCDCRTK